MNTDGSVNEQITDSVTQTSTAVVGLAPAQSMGMLDAVLVETVGMAMYGAVSRQQNAQMTATASITATCARILSAFAPAPAPTPPVPLTPPVKPADPPVVKPIPGAPPAASAAAQEAAAAVTALQGVDALTQLRGQSLQTAVQSEADLLKMANKIQPPAPTPGAGTPPAPPSAAAIQALIAQLQDMLKAANEDTTDADTTVQNTNTPKAKADPTPAAPAPLNLKSPKDPTPGPGSGSPPPSNEPTPAT